MKTPGQIFYETYLVASGWAAVGMNNWATLEAHRQRAWELAAEVAREEQVMATGAIRVCRAMLEAVSLAP
jgi:hypothetical protein